MTDPLRHGDDPVVTLFSSQSSRAARRRRWTGLFLVLLFVASQAYTAAHHSFVEHHVCPVEGRLAHGEHHHGSSAAGCEHGEECVHGSETASQCGDGPEDLVLHQSSSSEEHADHCSLPTTREERHEEDPPTQGMPAASWRPAFLAASQRHGSLLRLFRLAPKQSPPGIA